MHLALDGKALGVVLRALQPGAKQHGNAVLHDAFDEVKLIESEQPYEFVFNLDGIGQLQNLKNIIAKLHGLRMVVHAFRLGDFTLQPVRVDFNWIDQIGIDIIVAHVFERAVHLECSTTLTVRAVIIAVVTKLELGVTLLLVILLTLLALASVVTLFIGLFWIIPWASAAQAKFYDEVRQEWEFRNP